MACCSGCTFISFIFLLGVWVATPCPLFLHWTLTIFWIRDLSPQAGGPVTRPNSPSPGEMMCRGCDPCYRHSVFLLETDKDLKPSNPLFCSADEETEAQREMQAADICRASRGQDVGFPGQRLPLPCRGLRIPFTAQRSSSENSPALETQISVVSSSFSLYWATYLFWDQLNHARNRTSFSSQPASGSVSVNEWGTSSGEPWKALTSEQLQVLAPPGKLAQRLQVVIFHLPAS